MTGETGAAAGNKKRQLLLTSGETGKAEQRVTVGRNDQLTESKRARKAASSGDSIPSNLHSMSAAQLRAVCASHDLLHLVDKGMSKAELLDVLENEFYEQKSPPPAFGQRVDDERPSL